MDEQILRDRLLESENLTADLPDEEARWLIEWGLAQIPLLIEGLTDEDAAAERLRALMAFIRRVNRLAARKQARPPETLVEELRGLLELYQQAFGAARPASERWLEAAARTLHAMPLRQAVQFLATCFQEEMPAADDSTASPADTD